MCRWGRGGGGKGAGESTHKLLLAVTYTIAYTCAYRNHALKGMDAMVHPITGGGFVLVHSCARCSSIV